MGWEDLDFANSFTLDFGLLVVSSEPRGRNGLPRKLQREKFAALCESHACHGLEGAVSSEILHVLGGVDPLWVLDCPENQLDMKMGPRLTYF